MTFNYRLDGSLELTRITDLEKRLIILFKISRSSEIEKSSAQKFDIKCPTRAH